MFKLIVLQCMHIINKVSVKVLELFTQLILYYFLSITGAKVMKPIPAL